MKFVKLSLLLFLSVYGGSQAATPFSTDIFQKVADTVLDSSSGKGSTVAAASTLDLVTYTLVDSTLFLMQIAKTGLWLYGTGFEDPIGPLFDFTYNHTRVKCTGDDCVKEDIYMEFREPNIGGLESIKLYSDFQLDKLNLTLSVENFSLGCPGYRHTITNNATGGYKTGRRATLALRNTTYAITADYNIVPDVGIQVSNVDITLNIGEESWTVEERTTVLESGEVIDDGLHRADLSEGVMGIWKGQYEGSAFEQQYEQWAQFLLNCGLSGGRVSEDCASVKEQINKYRSLVSKH